MAKKIAQKIKKKFEKEDDPLQMLYILQRHIRSVAVEEIQNSKLPLSREEILSGYLIK